MLDLYQNYKYTSANEHSHGKAESCFVNIIEMLPVGGSPQTTPVMLQSIDASAQGHDIGHDLFFSAGRRCGICRDTFFLVGGFINWLAINLDDEPNLYIRNGCSMIYLPSVFNPVEKY